MSENSLHKIEELLAHQEQQINDLSEIVTRQWEQIDALKKRLGAMQDKIEAIEDAAKEGGQDGKLSVSQVAARDKPPHY